MFRGGKATASFSMTQCGPPNPNGSNTCVSYPPPSPQGIGIPNPVVTQVIQLNKS
jgi:hypothetical protein